MTDIEKSLKTIFENETNLKIAYNIKFSQRILKKHNIGIKGNVFDILIASYLLNPEGNHNLNYLSETVLGYKIPSLEDIIPVKNPSADEIKRIPVEVMKNFACESAYIIYNLHNVFESELKKENLWELYQQIEMPLSEVLACMEDEGIRINVLELEKFSKKLADEIVQLEKQIFELCGFVFNVSSPKQTGDVLFEKLKIVERPQKTKTKQFATGENILQKLKKKHPVIPLILSHRTLTKLKTTYVDSLPKYIEPSTGKIHTFFNQTVTATGRLSSSNPNLQNIPARSELGQEIRKAFIPRDDDFILVSADYSQIELRIIAALSNENTMTDDFIKSQDIHTATASKIYNIPVNEITPFHRRNAKAVNFGIIYGISAFGLSEKLEISKKEAENLMNEYFNKYPKIKEYIQKTISFVKQHGYTETIKKRKRLINNINSSNAFLRGIGERTAINASVQGSAADIIKIAMIKIHNRINQLNLKSRMLLQVHDELIFDVYKEETNTMKTIILEEMKSAFDLSVPVEVDLKHGINWLDAH